MKIDKSADLERFLQAARNARETGDDDSAIRHYEQVSALDPDNWEALFYLVVLKTNEIKNGQIQSAAAGVSNCLPKIFTLINEKIPDETQKKEAVWEVLQQCQETATWLTSASHNFYKSTTKGDGLMALTGLFGALSSAGSVMSALSEDTERCVTIANIMFLCGNYISEVFDMKDRDYAGYAIWAWQRTLEFHTDYQQTHKTQTLFDAESVQRLNNYINQYAPNVAGSPKEENHSTAVVLTLEFNANAGSAGQLLYSIDDGEKYKLNRNESQTFFLERGTHTLNILNPFMKKRHTFTINGPKTIRIYGKSFGMQIDE